MVPEVHEEQEGECEGVHGELERRGKEILFCPPQDECSFVSLRDVERAMIVFKYFYEKMALFGPLMDEKEEQEKTQQEVDVEVDIEPMDQVSTATFV